ncbi:muconate cycloisomerase [Thermoflexales bacterium]|nr:muconate cycloisomerase [Thermoflexales bacterium]
MRLTPEPVTLNLRTAFRLAHGVSQQRFNVFAHLDESGQYVGIGEGAVVPYYGDTQPGLLDYLAAVADRLGADPFLIEDILERLPPGPQAAKAAIDIALHDLMGKRVGQPLYRLFGLNPDRLPLTSFTIAMDEPARMALRARESGLPIIKIKLGGDQDEAMVAAVRGATSAKLRVDVNAGWTREQAARLIPRLKQYDIEFIEQPLAAADIEGLRWLKEQNFGVPIFADESIKTSRDIALHAAAIDGVVIKLMKTGGLREALHAIHIARAHSLQIMLSCMVETSVGVTAAAHLAPLCDYADLDGPLLIANDPYRGVRFDGARLILPDGPGLGVIPA